MLYVTESLSLKYKKTITSYGIHYTKSLYIDLAKPKSGALISLFSSPTLHRIKTVIKLSTGKSLYYISTQPFPQHINTITK